MSSPGVILVLCTERRRAESLIGRCARLGYAATAPYGTETELAALQRARATAVLVDLLHPAGTSPHFLRAAAASRARVVLLGAGVEDRRDGRILLLGRGAQGITLAAGDVLEVILATTTPPPAITRRPTHGNRPRA